MANVMTGRGWKLELADGWRGERHSAEYVLFPPDDGPVFTLNSPNIDSPLTVEDLIYLNRDHRDHIEDGHLPVRVTFGDFVGVMFEYAADDAFWLHGDLVCGNIWLEFAYDHAVSGHADHRACVKAMLNTLSAARAA